MLRCTASCLPTILAFLQLLKSYFGFRYNDTYDGYNEDYNYAYQSSEQLDASPVAKRLYQNSSHYYSCQDDEYYTQEQTETQVSIKLRGNCKLSDDR